MYGARKKKNGKKRLYKTAWYSIPSNAPDDERVICSKHVEQEKTVE